MCRAHQSMSRSKHAEPLKPSILILITPTLIPVFVKLPCPCQARGPGNSYKYSCEYSRKYSYEYSDKCSYEFSDKCSYEYLH